MKKARNLLVNYSTANSARKVLRQGGVRGASVEESVMKDSLDVEGGLFSAIRILTSSDENNLAETSATARSAEMKKREPSIKSVHSLKARQDGYDMQVVDRLLEAILGNGEMHTGTLGANEIKHIAENQNFELSSIKRRAQSLLRSGSPKKIADVLSYPP